MRTGLLSLNIHDSLTFEGAEFCLHPDLFTTPSDGAAGSQQTRRSNDDPGNTATIRGGTTTGSIISGTTTSNHSSPTGLSVGDFIEVRVWDPLPKELVLLRSPGGNSTTTRKQASRSSPSVPSISPSTSVQVEFPMPSSLADVVPANSSTLNAKTNLRPRADSLAYSDGGASDEGKDASTAKSSNVDKSSAVVESSRIGQKPDEPADALLAKTFAMPSSLPPVFPRSRANTVDTPGIQVSGPPTKSPNLPKPATIHRRAPSAAGKLQSQTSPKPSRHTRQISDMTMDTHHLDIVDMGIQNVDSQDDEATPDQGVPVGVNEWSKVSTTHRLRLSFVLLVTDKTLTSIKGNTRTQISILRQAADLYSLSSYDHVTVHRIDAQDEEEVLKAVSADFVVVTIKDQFISRGDMHLFQSSLQGTWIYEGQRLYEPTRQLKAHAREIRHGNYAAKSGIVTEKTMITFRSRSARIIWLVQLSSEMWDYSSPYEHRDQSESICEIYFDQWIRFLYKLFEKWKALEVTHSLTVIFFSRTFVLNGQKSCVNCQDVYGRGYEDHYKPVIENETCVDWESLVVRIKEEFVKYPKEVGWNLNDRRPSSASQGNVLEAVNVTLNIMQYHFMDRDLNRTGNSIVVVSPGCGVFEVDKGLASITYQRMMDNGIGSDMLSLGLPPLHIAPFFLHSNEFHSVETRGVVASEVSHEVPHWMHLSFISYDREEHQLGDHIHSEEKKTTTVKLDGLDSFEVGPNGFLRPKRSDLGVDAAMTKARQPSSSFSALGNKAATPGKAKSQQGRQLVSGREFCDILEASRPRLAGRLPSALVAILRRQSYQEDNDSLNVSGQLRTEPFLASRSHVPLREWGTVDFEIPPRTQPRYLRSESSGTRRSSNEIGFERGDNSEAGSAASSYASYVSSTFGMSYDRVLWDQYHSPSIPKNLFQIQRSPSLKFESLNPKMLIDADSVFWEENMSTSTDNASRSSLGQASSTGLDADWAQNDNDTTMSPHSQHDKNVMLIQELMNVHDAQVWAPMASEKNRDDIKVVVPESLQTVDSEVTLASGKRVQDRSGGLGAALSQYTNATTSEGMPTTLLTRRSSGSFIPSQSRNTIQPSSGNFHERNPRTMTPILMPPMSSLGYSIGSIDPPTYLRQDRDSSSALHRPLTIESSSSLSRDNAAMGAVYSGSNYDYGMPNSVGSFSLLDSPRYFMRPIVRSPPGTSLRPSGRSPPNLHVTSRAAPKIGSSPPNIGLSRDRPTTRHAGIELNPKSPPRDGGPKYRGVRRPSPAKPENTEKSRPKKTTPGEGNNTSKALRRRKACNPFRQRDEDEVLAKRSHNRRRWSHVFAAGDIEFKRHSGPIWNSLTAPAILPLSVDYFPSPQELRDERTFQFNPYTVTLSGIENKDYSTHAELMLELVRQRVTQDFQIVTAAAVKDSESRPEPQRQGRRQGTTRGSNGRRESFIPSLPTIKHDTMGTIKHYLSMGHRIQVLSYDPSSDTIEIVHYTRKSAQNDPVNVYQYRFMMFSRVSKCYKQSIQTFKKYTDPYKWNKVDNLICGEEERQLEAGMRFRRLMFGIIPDTIKSSQEEAEYVSKFQRLLEYLGKLRDKDSATEPLQVKVISNGVESGQSDDIFRTRSPTEDSMKKFTIQLKKGTRDPFEWIEIAIDSTLQTSRSYRIMFNWLVASSAKVEAQVQLLSRRCTQFGLQLMSFPQTSISRDLFLHVFAVPTVLTLRDKGKVDELTRQLMENEFIDDGIRFTDSQVLDCIEQSEDFNFPRYRSGKIRSIPSRQYVHKTGALFIRNIRDRQGWSILAAMENYRHESKENGNRETAGDLLHWFSKTVGELQQV